jgi:TonB family protein
MKRLLLFLCLVCACPTSPLAQSPNSDASPASKILVVIDKSTQEMKVVVDNVKRYTWKVSTGLPGFETPSGTYPARSLHRIWYSKQWDDAPMPHAIFFTKEGHAIHGTGETKKLGRLASHGCVRLAPENARTLFALIKEKGLKGTQIVLNGETLSSEVQVANPAPPLPEKKPPQADTQIVLNEEKPSSEAHVASPAPPLLEKKPPQENAQIVLNEEKPSSEAHVASPAPPLPEKKPPQENAQIVPNEEAPNSEPQVASLAKPKPEKKPKALASDVADVNAAKSREQRPVTKSVSQKFVGNDKLLDASVKKPRAQREKPATRQTASRSRSKPSPVETPARLLSAESSPKIANAAYAASVYGALARKKPRSVGASGSVTVSFAIGPSGSLRNALVARSSGKAPLDRAALALIRQAAPFSPPPASRQSYTITISFR